MGPKPCAALATAILLAAAACAQPEDNREVLAAARALDAAEVAGDRTAMERLLAPDLLVVGADGRISGRQDYVAGFTAPGHRLEPFRIIDPLFVRVATDVAIVGGETLLNGSEGGRPFTRHFRYADTFARRQGHWVAVYIQVTPLP